MCALPSPEDTMPSIRIDRPSGLLLMTVCNGAKQHVEQPLGIAMAGDLSWMEERYAHLEEQSLLWQPPTLESANTPRCTMDGKPTIMLSANNYLNLTTHPKVVEASIAATRKYGAGSGSVRAIAGTMDIHLEAEDKVAEFKGVESSLIYSAGYTANVGLIPSLVQGKQDIIISACQPCSKTG